MPPDYALPKQRASRSATSTAAVVIVSIRATEAATVRHLSPQLLAILRSLGEKRGPGTDCFPGVIGIRSTQPCCMPPAARHAPRRVSASASPCIHCQKASPPISWRAALTSASFRRCSATAASIGHRLHAGGDQHQPRNAEPAHGCALRSGAVSPSRPDNHKAPRTVAVKSLHSGLSRGMFAGHRSLARRAASLTAASTAPSSNRMGPNAKDQPCVSQPCCNWRWA